MRRLWWKSETLQNLQAKKTYGRETETDKEKTKKLQWTKEMIEYLLDSLK